MPYISYQYDARNHRVYKNDLGSSTSYYYFYGADGRRMGTYSWNGQGTITLDTTKGPEIYFLR